MLNEEKVTIKAKEIVISLDEILKNDNKKNSYEVFEKTVEDISRKDKGRILRFSLYEKGFLTNVNSCNFSNFEIKSIFLVIQGKRIEVNKEDFYYLRSVDALSNALKLLRLVNEDASLELTMASRYMKVSEKSYVVDKINETIFNSKWYGYKDDKLLKKDIDNLLNDIKQEKALFKEINEALSKKDRIKIYSNTLGRTKIKDFNYFCNLLNEKYPNLTDEEKLPILKIIFDEILYSDNSNDYKKNILKIKKVKEQILEDIIIIQKENQSKFNFYSLDFFQNISREDILFRILIIKILKNKLDEYFEYSSNIENTNGINRIRANVHLYKYITAKFQFFLYENQIFNLTEDILLENIEPFLLSIGDDLFPKRLKTETMIVLSKLDKVSI